MRKKIASIVASALMMTGLIGASALAWTYNVTGSGSCQPDGTFKITWTVDNSAESEALNITASSNTSLIPVGTQIAGHTTKDYTQSVSGSQAASFSLSLTGNFASDQTQRTESATVQLAEPCSQGGGQGGGDEDKVTLCHATSSSTNPYVRITVDSSGAYNGHYSQHTGPIFSPGASNWGDIIPTFSFNNQTYSLNWNAAGQAVFNNNCQVMTGGQGGGPQVDCDNDTDNSPASECAPNGGGQGGGSTPGVNLTSSTTTISTPSGGGQGAGVSSVPAGAVNAGGGKKSINAGSLIGFVASLTTLGFGVRRLRNPAAAS